jgi:hypothetical protein
MRGGVDSKTLFEDTDIDDLEILNRIIKDNIEMSKKSQMPLI